MTLDHVRSLSGGINQMGVRAYNERLLLSVLQRNGGLSGGDLARPAPPGKYSAPVISYTAKIGRAHV